MKTIIILSSVCILGYEINRKSKGVRSDIQFESRCRKILVNVLREKLLLIIKKLKLND